MMQYFQIQSNTTLTDIEQMVNTYPLDRIQIDKYINEKVLRLLNEEFFPKRPDVRFRVYGHPFKDLSFLSLLPNVKKLYINCIYDAVENLDSIQDLNQLEELIVDINNQKDFSFLDKVSNNLKYLNLNVNKTGFDANKILRFGGLEYLEIQNLKKNIHVIEELSELKSLRIKGISAPDLGFINKLKKLEELYISGGKNDLTTLCGNPHIHKLTLCSIRGLDNLDLISHLPNLKEVQIQYMSDISSLPDLSGLTALKKIKVISMKNLTDLSAAEFAPALERFDYYEVSKNLIPSDIIPVLKNQKVQVCGVFFPSSKKNKEADALCLQYGKKIR